MKTGLIYPKSLFSHNNKNSEGNAYDDHANNL